MILKPHSSEQNFWLKLAIFIISLLSAALATRRHVLWQNLIFLFYFACDRALYTKLIFAYRKILMFMTAYWLMGTLFGLDFIMMLDFSLRILFIISASVYFFASLDTTSLLSDLRGIRQYKAVQQSLFYFLATGYFIRAYLKLWDDFRDGSSATLREPISVVSRLLAANYRQSPQIESKVHDLLDRQYQSRDFLSYENLMSVLLGTFLILAFSV